MKQTNEDTDRFGLVSIYLVLLFLIAIAIFLFSTSSKSTTSHQSFLRCLLDDHHIPPTIITTRDSNSFSSLLNFSIQNPRIYGNTYPTLIVSPTSESHVQHTIICTKKHSIHIRVRSGGHDYEGLSYTSTLGPFVLLDLFSLRSISIDVSSNTAWVQSGATIGELYYAISEKAGPNVAFPAGVCPTVGIGGHLSGGGFGTLVRAFGLAADQVMDARLVSANGEIQNRKSMGEDLFWAIRGGGCCFGIILSFKVTLEQVPSNVTVFSASRILSQGVTKLVTKWQNVAYKLDKRLFIRVVLVPDKDEKGNKTVKATFNSLFLGSKAELLPLMEFSFPELGLQEKDCAEMSWIKSILYFSGYSSTGKNESALTERGVVDPYFAPFKAKSDFVREPISEQGWEKMWKWFFEENEFLIVILDPFGGRMDEISDSETPFPHRKGNLYNLQYMVKWDIAEGGELTEKHLNWMKRFYEFMTPYVSKNPRAAYYNYRDLDLGRTEEEENSYLMANVWGRRYFKDNFRRLAQVKSEVDPDNFFLGMSKVYLLSFILVNELTNFFAVLAYDYSLDG